MDDPTSPDPKGNDKGKVEGLVGFARRNFMVPVPVFDSFEALNAHLLECCRKRMSERLRGHSETIGERLERDLTALRKPLPPPYDACDKVATRVSSLSLVRYRRNDYSVPTSYGHREVVVRGYVHEVVISCGTEIIARHPRSYEREDFVFDPLHYLALIEQKINALDQAAPLADWKLPEEFATLRRLLEVRMGKKGKREFVQVLRLMETFRIEVVTAAVGDAIARGADGLSLPAKGHGRDDIGARLYGPSGGSGVMTDTPQVLLAHHLKALKLPTILREYDKIARQCAAEGVDYPRYLLRLVEAEIIERERRMVDRRIKAAKFPTVKSLDSFDFAAFPDLNKALVMELARSEYVERRENVIAVGNSGTGKSHIGLGLISIGPVFQLCRYLASLRAGSALFQRGAQVPNVLLPLVRKPLHLDDGMTDVLHLVHDEAAQPIDLHAVLSRRCGREGEEEGDERRKKPCH